MTKPAFANEKTIAQISCAVTAQLISAFVLATYIEQFLFFLNQKFQASNHLLRMYSLLYVGNPEGMFSCDTAYIMCPIFVPVCCICTLLLFFCQIHHIDFDDENNVINKNVFLHKEGEIWHISASTLERNLLTTCYNKSEF